MEKMTSDETATIETQGGRWAHAAWWLAAVGMLASAGSTWLLCRRFLPSGWLSPLRVLLTGGGVVVFPAATAVGLCWVLSLSLGGDRTVGSGEPRFRRLVLACGVAWVLIPAIGMLLQVDSAWALLLMVAAAVASAPAIRRLAPLAGDGSSVMLGAGQAAPFGMLPASNSGIWVALAVSAGLEGAAIPFVKGSIVATGVLLAAAVFVLLWQWTSTSARRMEEPGGATTRVAGALLLAILVTTAVLLARMGGGFGGNGSVAAHGRQG